MVATKRDYQVSVICMAVLSVSFLVVALFGYFYKPLEVHEYGVVVDISSYDIEFNLYRWKNRKTISSTAQVKKKYTISCEINIHKEPMMIEKFRETMFQCLKYVITHIENYELYNSTIFIYGTELTRIICEKDPEKCNVVFGTVAEVIAAFEMNVMMTNIKPLTGFEEALFGWISVNFFFKNIQNGRKGKHSYSGLDIKNYSVLISQEMGPDYNASENLKSETYSICGHDFNVVGADLMCYGVRQAYDRTLLSMLEKLSTWSSSVTHPCHLSGYTNDINPHSLKSPCITSISTTLKSSYHITGKYDEGECKKLILDSFVNDKLINLVKDEILNDTDRTYFGFSRLAEVANMIEFSRVNLEEFFEEAIDRCANAVNISFSDFCFDAIYMNTLIVDKLNIAPKSVIIGNKEKIETVTGSMIYHSREIKPRRAANAIGNYGFMFIIFSLLVFSGLGVFLMRKTKNLNKDVIV